LSPWCARHGRVKKGDKILVKSTGKIHLVDSVGVFNPKHRHR
jgi:GTP-binding protein LepA